MKQIYSEESVLILLDLCWEASDDYNDQCRRIGDGLSNFTKPTYPNKEQWITQKLNK